MRFFSALCLWLACTSPASAQIKLAKVVDPYQPIVVESASEATAYTWSYPAPLVGIQIDNGRSVHLWAPPGKYRVQLTTISVDWEAEKLTTATFTAAFTVGDPQPGPKPPGPKPPTPKPANALAQKTQEALGRVDAGFLNFSKTVAANYRRFADEAAAAPSEWTPETLSGRVATANATSLPTAALAGWAGFWAPLTQALVDEKIDSSDLDGFVAAFRTIADAIEGAAK